MGSVEYATQARTERQQFDDSMDGDLFRHLWLAADRALGGNAWPFIEQGVDPMLTSGGPFLVRDTIECFAPSLGLASVEFSSPHSANA